MTSNFEKGSHAVSIFGNFLMMVVAIQITVFAGSSPFSFLKNKETSHAT